MILVYIKDYEFLTKIVQYLGDAKVSYTTDMNDNFDYVLVADMSKSTFNFIKNNPLKKIIFLTEIEEARMYQNMISNTKKSKLYCSNMYKFLNKCYKVITSSMYIKKELIDKYKNVFYIPSVLPTISFSGNNKDIYEKYSIKKRKKVITIFDLLYKHVDVLFYLSEKYPKYHFVYIGYNTYYNLSFRYKNFLKMIGSNVTFVKYVDETIFSDVCKVSNYVIYYESFIKSKNYIYIPLLLKRSLLVEDILWYRDFIVNSKNAYLFKNNDSLYLKFSKILENRVMNLTENGYELVISNNYPSIIKKYSEYL